MPLNHQVAMPTIRSTYRRKVGKLFYILRRKFAWQFDRVTYATELSTHLLPHVLKSHQSLLLRPLRNVDMQLQYNKIANLRLAIRHLHGIVIKPGEVFSFWYLVGNPSKQKGYLPGLILNQGRTESGYGGGLCQLGNLLFWMAVHTPLTIKERHRHGFDVFPDVNRTLPFGSGATLAYNYIDFQLKNDTENSFQILLWLTDEHLQGEIRCDAELNHDYKIYESDHQIVHQSWGGYTRHNRLNRIIFNKTNGALVADEPFLENHAIMMYDPLLAQHATKPS